MKFDNVIFDFDGTLADTSPGVLGSVRYALETLGAPVPDEKVLRGFIGPSLYSSFTGIIGFDGKKADEAIALYRSVYNPRGVYECKLYDGMKDLLIKIKAAGVSASVASSKPQNALDKVVDFLGVREYFDRVVGADPDDKHDNKALIVAAARTRDNAVMIGDSRFDIEAAKKVGIKSIAAGYGFTAKDVLLSLNPDYYADKVADITEILE